MEILLLAIFGMLVTIALLLTAIHVRVMKIYVRVMKIYERLLDSNRETQIVLGRIAHSGEAIESSETRPLNLNRNHVVGSKHP